MLAQAVWCGGGKEILGAALGRKTKIKPRGGCVTHMFVREWKGRFGDLVFVFVSFFCFVFEVPIWAAWREGC